MSNKKRYQAPRLRRRERLAKVAEGDGQIITGIRGK